MDDNTPATKGDISTLANEMRETFVTKEEAKAFATKDALNALRADMQQGFNAMNQQFDQMHKRFSRLDGEITQILDVLVSVDKRTKANHKDHEQRLRVVEKLLAV